VYLLTDQPGARAMGEKGLAWVDQEWRWGLVARRLQEILSG
jgi:phosphatidylinositol alpha-1,6-mannosyltransferase